MILEGRPTIFFWFFFYIFISLSHICTPIHISFLVHSLPLSLPFFSAFIFVNLFSENILLCLSFKLFYFIPFSLLFFFFLFLLCVCLVLSFPSLSLSFRHCYVFPFFCLFSLSVFFVQKNHLWKSQLFVSFVYFLFLSVCLSVCFILISVSFHSY